MAKKKRGVRNAAQNGRGQARESGSGSALYQASDKRNRCDDQEDDEENLRNPRCSGGDTAEAEHGSNKGNHKKDNGVMQHESLLFEADAQRQASVLRASHRIGMR